MLGLQQRRREIARLLWRLWSPGWRWADAEFEASAAAFDNPDWVEVVVQSYRHRFGQAVGDPALDEIEARLATLPPIAVPTVVLHGEEDGVAPPASSADLSRFTGAVRREVLPGVGHNPPQEAPDAFVGAVLELVRR